MGGMSITAAERKALVFLVSLLGLGAGVRLAGALRHTASPVAESARARLDNQVAAVDSVRSRALADRARRRASRGRIPRPKVEKPPGDTLFVIDVDRATAEELERLPRVGPTLAKRIVSDRDAHGSFGSLTELMRVKGIGPKLKQRIASHVTFSGSVRPSTALSVSPGSVPRAGRPL
ncbi:MAG: ComEA family DNA-binding protein, partial [Gemmatimonadaceae bacterium]